MIANNVMGMKITRVYFVESYCNDAGKFTCKPALSSNDSIEWDVIHSFTGTHIRPNGSCYYAINLAEDEEVTVHKEVFRADTNTMLLYTDKEIEVTEQNKESAEADLSELLRQYNKQGIEGDERLLAYCNLHNLCIEETDVDKLRKVVYDAAVAMPAWAMSPVPYDSIAIQCPSYTVTAMQKAYSLI